MDQECKHQGGAEPYQASSAIRYVTQKEKKIKSGRATNLTRIGIGRIGVDISAGN